MEKDLAAQVAQLKAQVEDLQLLKAEVVMLRAEVQGLREASAMNRKRVDQVLPLYALLATRTRAIEEKTSSADEAATVHRYWVQALRTIGVNPDPLNLENNE